MPSRPQPQPKLKRPKREAPPPVPTRRSARGTKAPDYFVADETVGGAIVVGGRDKHKVESTMERELVPKDPLARFGEDYMPEGEDDLLEGEREAFAALREVKRAKASELQIEGYKIAQHRSLCEVVRRRVASLDELRECWGFGGSGVRVQKYGELFVTALHPFLDALASVHKNAEAEAEARGAAAESSDRVQAEVEVTSGCRGDEPRVEQLPRALRLDEAMPQHPSDLLPVEKEVFDTLIAATHVRAEEIGERWLWNIAQARSLCDMVRRRPSTLDELRQCWGFGGSGLRAQRHGSFLLDAIEPHLPSLRAQHRAAGLLTEAGAAVLEDAPAHELGGEALASAEAAAPQIIDAVAGKRQRTSASPATLPDGARVRRTTRAAAAFAAR